MMNGKRGMPLTKRQQQIVNGVQRGLTNKQIAIELGLSHSMVKEYVCDATRRTGFDRFNLIRFVLREHERQQAVRLNEWVKKWADRLPEQSAAEIKAILAQQIAEVLQ